MVPSSRGSHDKLDKVPIDAIRGEMEALGLTEHIIQKLLDTIALKDLAELEKVLGGSSPALQQIKDLFTYAEAYGFADWLVFDASVVSGLAYYTGLVFEGFDRKGERCVPSSAVGASTSCSRPLAVAPFLPLALASAMPSLLSSSKTRACCPPFTQLMSTRSCSRFRAPCSPRPRVWRPPCAQPTCLSTSSWRGKSPSGSSGRQTVSKSQCQCTCVLPPTVVHCSTL